MLVDPHTTSEDRSRLFVTGRGVVHTTSSKHRSTWWSRERLKNISRHRRHYSQVFKGLKGDIEMEDHRAHCLQEHARMSFEWRRASHFVSFRCLGCVNIRSHCV